MLRKRILRVCVCVCVCVCCLTRQEVALSIQDLLDVSDPDLLDVDVGGLQGEALRRAATRQDELTGIVVHAVLQTQVGHLWGAGQAGESSAYNLEILCYMHSMIVQEQNLHQAKLTPFSFSSLETVLI